MSSSVCNVLLCIFVVTLMFSPQSTESTDSTDCQRTNKEAFRYCTNSCSSDSDCKSNQKCLCDEDCGMSCVRNNLRCEPPSKPKNSRQKSSNGRSFNSVVTYTCMPQFKLRGSSARTCRAIGKWDGKKARCIVQCDDPGRPANGAKIVNKGFVYGGSVTFTCNKDYTLRGMSTIYCQGNREWTASVPRCLAPCPDPGLPYRGNRIGEDFRHDKTVTFTCPRDYRMEGVRMVTCSDGRWSNRKPSCEDCQRTNKEAFRYCTKPCSSDSDCKSNQKCLCDEDCGMSCVRNNLQCEALSKVKNSRQKSSNGRSFNSVVTYTCKPPFKLHGSSTRTSTRTCRAIGKWDGKKARCRIICKDPGEISKIVCLETREWSAPKPKCELPPCDPPKIPDSAFVYYPRRMKKKFKYSDRVFLKCHSGYSKLSGGVLSCKGANQWTGNVTCSRSDCPVLGTPLSGRKYGSKYNNGDIVTFECDPEFVLKGSAVRKCLENGTWNGTEAICTGNSDKTTGYRGINLNANGGLDLVFVIQASSSVKKGTDFKSGLEFAKELVRTIGASKRADGTRIAAVSFGTEARLEFNLGEATVNTMEKAIEAIDKIMYMGGATASALALRMVRKVVLPQAREDSHRVMMFITDGMSNIGGPPQKEAHYLREIENFEIYAIGVGKKVRIRDLMGIASADENRDHVIFVKKYKTLQEAIRKAVYIKIDYSPCGVSPIEFRARMVGGKNSKRGLWPWQIGLYKNNDEGLQLICGGALISRRWILTAAHCFYHWIPIFQRYRFIGSTGEYLVKAGDHNLHRDERSQQEIYPEKFFVHRDYVDRKFMSDIALIKLRDKVELSRFVRTLCLPEKDEGDLAIPTKYGFATGWGVTQALKPGEDPKPENRYSTRLQHSAYTIQSDQLCANRSVIAINSTVTFCVGDGKGGSDTCHGDSGGALVREGKRGEHYRWVATGLVSWSLGCAQPDQYGYYTRVYPFTDWIKNTIKENTEADD